MSRNSTEADAARYRWLKSLPRSHVAIACLEDTSALDEAIDAAIVMDRRRLRNEAPGIPANDPCPLPAGTTLADKLREYLPDGDGWHSEYANTLRDAADALDTSHGRYEFVRLLNPRQFAELCRTNITQGIPFDDLVDEWREHRMPEVAVAEAARKVVILEE